jgi:hypothetical protein
MLLARQIDDARCSVATEHMARLLGLPGEVEEEMAR